MSDRNALDAALDTLWDRRTLRENELIDTAARERLAQLPEKRAKCIDPMCVSCPDVKVYPAEVVERIAETIADYYGDECMNDDGIGVAVLDALNSAPSSKNLVANPATA